VMMKGEGCCCCCCCWTEADCVRRCDDAPLLVQAYGHGTKSNQLIFALVLALDTILTLVTLPNNLSSVPSHLTALATTPDIYTLESVLHSAPDSDYTSPTLITPLTLCANSNHLP
jgi:hypothetical protein